MQVVEKQLNIRALLGDVKQFYSADHKPLLSAGQLSQLVDSVMQQQTQEQDAPLRAMLQQVCAAALVVPTCSSNAVWLDHVACNARLPPRPRTSRPLCAVARQPCCVPLLQASVLPQLRVAQLKNHQEQLTEDPAATLNQVWEQRAAPCCAVLCHAVLAVP